MKSLFGNLFAKEFVIDESPEDVSVQSSRKLTTRTWSRDSLKTGDEEQKKRDLLSQISSLLEEQERLEHLTDELRNRSKGPEKEELTRFFKSALIVLDSFDRVTQMAESLAPSEELHNWLKSVAAIQSRMITLFERYGLRAMDPVGKQIDLDRHEVIEVLHTDSVPDETILEVRQKGYTFNDKILRDARVVVAKNGRT